jgi:hypothetical protein
VEELHVLPGRARDLGAEILFDPLREVRDASERRLEVVRGDVGELIELPIGLGERV